MDRKDGESKRENRGKGSAPQEKLERVDISQRVSSVDCTQDRKQGK